MINSSVLSSAVFNVENYCRKVLFNEMIKDTKIKPNKISEFDTRLFHSNLNIIKTFRSQSFDLYSRSFWGIGLYDSVCCFAGVVSSRLRYIDDNLEKVLLVIGSLKE